mmetsp:Transcript_69011/g.200237  ORF Transcript_69011/g.200237 Transcript_69011/m.200237 type:complete len:221 (-) Transcript_69011:227-889(-)
MLPEGGKFNMNSVLARHSFSSLSLNELRFDLTLMTTSMPLLRDLPNKTCMPLWQDGITSEPSSYFSESFEHHWILRCPMTLQFSPFFFCVTTFKLPWKFRREARVPAPGLAPPAFVLPIDNMGFDPLGDVGDCGFTGILRVAAPLSEASVDMGDIEGLSLETPFMPPPVALLRSAATPLRATTPPSGDAGEAPGAPPLLSGCRLTAAEGKDGAAAFAVVT